MKISKSRVFAKYGLHILGFLLSVLPPVLATLFYFPLWRESGQVISGGVLFLLLLSALPLYKLIREKLRSPAAYTIWGILFILFFALSRIAREMTVISFFGFSGNALGALCFNIGKRIGGEKNE